MFSRAKHGTLEHSNQKTSCEAPPSTANYVPTLLSPHLVKCQALCQQAVFFPALEGTR